MDQNRIDEVVSAGAAVAESAVKGEGWVGQSLGVLIALIRTRESIEAEMKEAAEPYKTMLAEVTAPFQTALDKMALVEEALRSRVMKEHAGAEGVKGTEGEYVFAQPWKWEVIDPGKVPKAYLTADSKAITQAVKDGIRKLAGVKVYQDRTLTVRKSK